MFLPNPGILAAGVEVVSPYGKFVQHITALATSGSAPWDVMTNPSGASSYITAAGPTLSGVMVGSSWGEGFYYPFSVPRMLQHGFPSLGAITQQQANGWKIFFKVTRLSGSNYNFSVVDRNGYESQTGDPDRASICNEIIRWDGVNAWKSDPSARSAETLYTGWM